MPNPPTSKFWNVGVGRRLGRLRPLIAAVTLAVTLQPTASFALALGKLSASSHMGERLSAEIAIPEATAPEIASLKTSLAKPEVYEALGIEFNPALLGAEVSLQKRADGQYFVKVTTQTAINDPFVNLVVVATWSSGRIVRDYALLLDPPDLIQKAPVLVAAPAIATTVEAAPSTSGTLNTAATTTPSPKVDTAEKPVVADKKPVVEKVEASKSNERRQLTVTKGMTAGQIAAQVKPADISLDQMLVMLLQSNPSAFINGNVNLIRAGAVIDVPGAAQGNEISKPQGQKLTTAETKDFEDYKRRLATIAKASDGVEAKSKSTGKIETKVNETKATSATPDKLLLSSSDKDKKSAESKLASDLQAKEDAARRAALNENINNLKKLSADIGKPSSAPNGSSLNPSASAAPTTAASGAGLAALPLTGVSAGQPESSASAPAIAPAPVNPVASQAVASAKQQAAAPTPEESGFLSDLLGNPFLLPGAAGLIALLVVLTYVRRVKQKKEAADDSSFFDSRLRQDSFFAESGGQTIDTQHATVDASHDSTRHTTESYTSTQMNQNTDVDPIAEADVYLAYGRDMQAEEILKDAMVLQPTRLAIPLKLMELYAKHGETNDFEKLAEKVKSLTDSNGPEWNRVQDLRKVLNSNIKSSTEGSDLAASSQNTVSGQNVSKSDGERSIWFESDASSSLQPENSIFAPSKQPLDTLGGTRLAELESQVRPSDLPSISAQPNSKIDFDFSGLSLDLKSNPASQASLSAPSELSTLDPWQTKLALAKEFQAIGDVENARKLANEVIAGNDESLKAQAQALLAELST